MYDDPDCVVIEGEPIFEGTSLFVSPTGEVAWITGIEGNHVQVETVDKCGKISMTKFRNRIIDEDYVLESRPNDPEEPRS